MTTTPATSIMWLALPAGVVPTATTATAALSVFVSPRLTGPDGATLADFPLFAQWASTVAGASFQLTLDDGSAVAATVVSLRPDLALWAQLFPPATPVIPRTFDESNVATRTPSTYPQQAVHQITQNGYAGVHVSSPVTVPVHQQLRQALPAFAPGGPPRPLLIPEAGRADEVTALRRAAAQVADDLVAHAAAGTLPEAVAHAHAVATRLAELSPPGTYIPLVADTGTDPQAVGAVLAFHQVPPAQVGVSPGPKTDPVAPDFHAVLTSLLAYPLLLRQLGLVIDLQVQLADVPTSALPGSAANAPAPRQLRIAPPPLAGATMITPWTAYTRDGDNIFSPAPTSASSPETIAGLLNLAPPQTYSLIQLDVDGATIKAAYATSAANTDPAAPSPLPSLRTTGLTLSRTGQGQALLDRMTKNAANDSAVSGNPAAPVTLYAEDVLYGLRLDVLDAATGAWASLHRRIGTYTVAGQLVLTGAADEGTAQPSASHLPDLPGASPSPLRLPEALARWEGWSLSVPQPGAAVTDTGPSRVTSAPAPGGVPLTATFTAVPGSLPRLRYGRKYQLRARAVDVAGNSLSVAEADELLQSLPRTGRAAPVLPADPAGQVFQRFEPVNSPVPVPREQFTEGESAELLVIRSDRAESAASCGQRLSGLAVSTGLRYLAVNERHLVPPKVTLTEVERQGRLDALSAEAAYALAAKQPGQLTDTFVVDPATGLPGQLATVPDTNPVTGAPAVPRPAVELVAFGGSTYAVHHEPALIVPYLPDPMSAGVVLCGLPGQPGGTQATAGSSSALSFDQWTLDDASAQAVGCTTAAGFSGTWPLVAPVRLSLTEGAGPPAWDPDLRVLTVALPKGRSATVRVSSYLPDDDALDILGIWSWVLAQAGQTAAAAPELAARGLAWLLTPYRELTLVHAVQQPLTDPDLSNATATRQLGDTGVTLSLDIAVDAPSTARLDVLATWTDQQDDPAAAGPAAVASSAAVLNCTVPPAASAGQLTGSVLQLAGPQQFGDTKHRSVSYTATAASAFREYFPAAIADSDMSATGTPVTVDVPSSARPPAPVVRAAVPIFSWQRPDGMVGTRIRTQVGIRLLLERPWFASGGGEQLAVVLAPARQYPPSDALRPYVTYWGNDPIWGSGTLPGLPPTTATFNGPDTAPLLTLTEAGQQVQVIPLPVTFRPSADPSQQLWECDVLVNVPVDEYQPFVRLAVARYQPNSLAGAELSPVALAPPVQLLPQRTVTVSPGSDPDTVNVQVEGTTYWATALPAPPAPPTGTYLNYIKGIEPAPDLVGVGVEGRIPGTTDDLGWQPVGAQVTANVHVSGIPAAGQDPGTVLWQGSVTLPANRPAGQYRIVVSESQLLLSDVQQTYSVEVSPNPFDYPQGARLPKPYVEYDTYAPGSGRLVFFETIPV
jgi:hypothetical protein